MREIKPGLKICTELLRGTEQADASVQEELAWEGEAPPPRPTGGFFEGIREHVDRRFEQDS